MFYQFVIDFYDKNFIIFLAFLSTVNIGYGAIGTRECIQVTKQSRVICIHNQCEAIKYRSLMYIKNRSGTKPVQCFLFRNIQAF